MPASPQEFSLEAWAAPVRRAVEARLVGRFAEARPPAFARACAYPLTTGGKRFRPLVVAAAAEAAGRPADEAVVGAAAAVELIHTYSLVHDDLPAMDDDDERRGRPTVHVAFGEAPALLVGDALLTEAFALLAGLELPAATRVALVGELARAAGHQGMVGGQALDIGLGGPVTDEAALLALHRAKTGALIEVSARMGGLCAGAADGVLARLGRWGAAVGLAFQLADDLLDRDEDAAEGGPPSFVKVLGEAATRARAEELLAEALDAVAPLPGHAPLAALARLAVHRDH